MDQNLQFDRVEIAGPRQCAGCQQLLTGEYFMLGTQSLCSACRDKLLLASEPPSGAAKFLRAAVLGLAAAMAGALVWTVVTRVTGFEIGLIAVGIGYAVGRAVQYGAGGRGGAKYQALAMVLSYAAMVSNYAPAVWVWEATQTEPTALVVALIVAAPFLIGYKNIIGLLIIGFALYEAWKMNRRVRLPLSGPFQA